MWAQPLWMSINMHGYKAGSIRTSHVYNINCCMQCFLHSCSLNTCCPGVWNWATLGLLWHWGLFLLAKAGHGGGEVNQGRRVQKGPAAKWGESKAPVDFLLSEHGKSECQWPKVRPSNPPHTPGHQSLTKAIRWLLSPFEVALVPELWLTAHFETECGTLSCTSHAESSGAALKAQTS